MTEKISFCLLQSLGTNKVPAKLTIIPKPNEEGFLNLTEEEREFRKIKVGDLEQIIKRSYKAKDKFPIDVAHQSESPFSGDEGRALGYFHNLRVEDGSIVASSEWNEEGLEKIKEKKFLYLSPAFTHDRIANEGEEPYFRIKRISSIALTNSPAQEQKSFLNESGKDGIKLKQQKTMTQKTMEVGELEKKVLEATDQIQQLSKIVEEVSKQNKELLGKSETDLKDAEKIKDDAFQNEVKTYLESKSKEGVISKADEQNFQGLAINKEDRREPFRMLFWENLNEPDL